ncbi:TetR/AcrR family transcriptional regulator [Nocardioides sp. CPCC 205120]|uniref:TetR/AcrR family transcriptional regulator n=1 Tax=Nocardioides sp. CPCC 205120 TaxID=3406462 RepID=UPI003B508398
MARAGVTAERVVREAADLVDAEGLGALRVAAVAERLGVRPASVYAHVAGLDEIRTAVTALALGELADRAGDAVAGRAGRDALVAYADVVRSYAQAHPGRYAATRLRVAPGSPAVAAGRRHAELTRAVLRGYDLPAEAEVLAVRLLGSVVHGYVDLELSGAFDHSDPPPAATWPGALDALDAALRGWAA